MFSEKRFTFLQKSLDFIVWESSRSWTMQSMHQKLNDPDLIQIWTSRKKVSVFENWAEISFEPWLDLSKEIKIKEWIMAIRSKLETLFSHDEEFEVNLFLHAMAIEWIESNYPAIIVDEIRQMFKNANINISLISYEKDSHIPYWAREKKDEIEQSMMDWIRSAESLWIIDLKIEDTLSTDKQTTIDQTDWTVTSQSEWFIDLIVYDSYSSKKIWLTHLWVVWDFVSFLETIPDSDLAKSFGPEIKSYLWEDYDTIKEFFIKYPIRWDLWLLQRSLDKEDKNWNFQGIMNKLLKIINSAKFARISWTISDLYTFIAFWKYEDSRWNLDSLGKWSNRILLSWENVHDYKFKCENTKNHFIKEITKKTQDYCKTAEEVSSKRNLTLVEIGRNKNEKTVRYEVNWSFEIIDFLWEHFWVKPLWILWNEVLNSWLIDKNERLSTRIPKWAMYAWNNIEFKRIKKWTKSLVIWYNPDNPSEIFVEFGVVSKDTEAKNVDYDYETWIRNETYIIPWENKFNIREQDVPHSINYCKNFHNGIPKEWWFGWKKEIKSEEALIEYVWIQIANFRSWGYTNDLVSNMYSLLKTTVPTDTIKKVKDRDKKITPDAVITELGDEYGTYKNTTADIIRWIKWMYSKANTTYLHPDFERIIKEDNKPNIVIKNKSQIRWSDLWYMLIFDIDVVSDKWKLISSHSLSYV